MSFDFCCRGIQSNYNIRVGRATEITGPYVDRAGQPLADGGGTLLLESGQRWRGTGHNGILVDGSTYWIVYHAYDAQAAGIPTLRIAPLTWDSAGWPSVRPEQ